MTKRRLIPDPDGAVMTVAASGIGMVNSENNDVCHSGLDTYAGPWGPDTFAEQYSNNRVTLNSMDDTCGRQLCGKMKTGR